MTHSDRDNWGIRNEKTQGYSEYWGTSSNQPNYQHQPTQYPPYPSPPPLSYNQPYYQQYPQYYQPPPKQSDSKIIFIIIIVVVLFFVAPIIIAGIMWAMLSNIGPEEHSYISIASTKKESGEYYTITISSVSGGDLNLNEVQFKMIDDGGALEYSLWITDSDPDVMNTGDSNIYPLTKYSMGVTDKSTGYDVNILSEFNDYENCYIAYVDQDRDYLVSSGDKLYIFKDYNNNGSDDIGSKYMLRIMDGKDIIMDKPI